MVPMTPEAANKTVYEHALSKSSQFNFIYIALFTIKLSLGRNPESAERDNSTAVTVGRY